MRSVAKFVVYKFVLPSFRRIGLQYDTLDLTKQANFGPSEKLWFFFCDILFSRTLYLMFVLKLNKFGHSVVSCVLAIH